MNSISRKEVATLIEQIVGVEVSVYQVMSNEKHWGIREARLPDLNKRVVRYDKMKVEAIIRCRFVRAAKTS